MNPSAKGWIKKHYPVFEKEVIHASYSKEEYYNCLLNCGFIYANSLSAVSYPNGTKLQLNLEELSKVNLFDALGFMYFHKNPQAKTEDFVANCVGFYHYLKTHSWFEFKIPLLKSTKEEELEKILSKRIQTNQSVIQKNFSSLLSNALLFLEVLVYEHYLSTEADPLAYAKSLEALIANTIYVALSQKSNKDEYDKLVMGMLDASIRYNQIEEVVLNFEDLNYNQHRLPLECRYLLDLTCMTVYADNTLEETEKEFVLGLGKKIGFNSAQIQESIHFAQAFMEQNKGKIFFLDDSNPIKNLYDNSSKTVRTLIIRNKKRLIQEIRQSRELVELLRKSTSTELNADEKQKVRTQLLDICKVVPSLAIFILPGGSILLPILIRFIPDLLPSAFDDNKV